MSKHHSALFSWSYESILFVYRTQKKVTFLVGGLVGGWVDICSRRLQSKAYSKL